LSATRRLFFALWPEAAWAAQLSQLAAPLLRVARGRAVPVPNLHLTVCFLGEVEETRLAALRRRAGQVHVPAFELVFQRLEFLPKARVLAATGAAAPPAATALAEALASAAADVGLTPDPKPWLPHVTLMRNAGRPSPTDGSAAPWPLFDLRLPVLQFYLAESQRLGSNTEDASQTMRYARLASWPLVG